MSYVETPRRRKPRATVMEGFERGPLGSNGCSGPDGMRRWPDAPADAKYPLAHLRPEDVEPESVRMMSEVLKALRPFREAKAAVRERFRELFRDEPS